MYKGIVLLKRPPGTSVEDFRKWFLGPHLDYSRARPEVLKYTGSFTAAPAPASPFQDGEPAYDILVEIWCKDLESVKNAFAANQAAGGINDSLRHAGIRIAYIAEEHVVFDRTTQQ